MPGDGTASTIRFRPARADDLPMLRDWLARPHLRQWWGDPDEELGYIRDMIEGRDTTRPFIFDNGREPLGYIQSWFADEHRTPRWLAEAPWIAHMPEGTVGVDLFIGDAEMLSKGYGSAALAAFSRSLFEQGHRDIIIDPNPANTRAIRAYTRAGFSPIAELKGRTEGVLIMKFAPGEKDETVQ